MYVGIFSVSTVCIGIAPFYYSDGIRMRPKLPSEVEQRLPEEIVKHIYSFVPYPKKPKIKESPSLQKELTKIQSAELKGKSAMYMRGLDDFCLK